MRPPPGGTSAHNVRTSGSQKERISSARRGRIGGMGPSGATGDAAAVPAGGGARPSPIAITASRQGGDNAAALACRQRKAAESPGRTPGQCTPKSARQAVRTAAIGDGGDFLSSTAAGSAAAAAGSAAGGEAGAAAAGSGAVACGAGGGAAGAGAGAALSVGRDPTASSAALQDGDTLAALRLRHSSASRVPG